MKRTLKIARCLTAKCLLLACTALPLHATSSYVDVKDLCQLHIKTLKERQTAKIRLENGLQAYLISDPLADKSAAALAVETGSWSDPQKYPGMAHFLEHMLFLGSEKYPEEDGLIKKVLDSNGLFNAYTAFDRTVYMFSIENSQFTKVFDQFAHFFIDPLFDPSGLSRELHAVDQEHHKNIENDMWREWMILKELGNQDHPNATFSTGNSKTLQDIPRKEMQQWFLENYGANRSHLVVYSPLALEELKLLVAGCFAQAFPNPQKVVRNKGPLLSTKQFGSITYIQPVQNIRKLSLHWDLPESFSKQDPAKAALIVSTLLGFEGKGGLCDTLKKRNLAESAFVYAESLGQTHSLFHIDVDLTQEGVSAKNQVLELIFSAIRSYQVQTVPRYIYDEIVTKQTLRYAYQPRMNAFDFVVSHANGLVDEPLETYPQHTHLPRHFDPKKVRSVLECLTPTTCYITLTAPQSLTNVPATNEEKWLGGKYAIQPLNKTEFSRLSDLMHLPLTEITNFALPPPNPFMPSHLELKPHIANDGPKIFKGKNYTLCFQQDSTYLTPHVAYNIALHSPRLDNSAHSQVCCDVFLETVNNHFRSTLEQAFHAGLASSLMLNSDAQLVLSIDGYSEKAPLLLEKWLVGGCSKLPSAEEFARYLTKVQLSYENASKDLPFRQAQRQLRSILHKTPTTKKSLQAALNLTYEEYLDFQRNLFNQTYLKATITGNLTQSEALQTIELASEYLGGECFPQEKHPTAQILSLSRNTPPTLIRDALSIQGHVATLLLQNSEDNNLSNVVSHKLLGIALQQDFFVEIRTRQQTAYIAKAWSKQWEPELVQLFSVQSTTHSPEELLARFELFLESIVKDFEKIFPKARFESMKQSLIQTLRQPPTNLLSMREQLHYLAFEKEGNFEWIQQQLTALETLSYARFQEYVIQLLSRENHRRLALALSGIPVEGKDFHYEETTADRLQEDSNYLSLY